MKKIGLLIAAGLGAATVVYLIQNVGFDEVFSAVAALGWRDFAIFCGFGVALYALLAISWLLLIADGPSRRWPTFIWGRAVRDLAGEILPLSQLGGFVIGARAVVLRGVPASEAYASTIVDVTAEMLAQIAYVLLGAAILVWLMGLRGDGGHLLIPLLIGVALAVLGAVGFIFVQRRGPAFAEGLAEKLLPAAVSHAGAFARAIERIYKEPARIFMSVGVHCVGWIAGAGISYYAVRMIGGEVSFLQMVVIESALSAIRSAAVVVPSAMGVQEATYAMLMPIFGVSPAIGLALSLIKRACSIVVGVPVLLTWQGLESRRAVAVRARGAVPSSPRVDA